MTCPHCNWAEFTPVRPAVRVREGAVGRLLAALLGRPLTRRVGAIVLCCKCATQYVVSGIAGAYRIDGTQEPVRANGHDRDAKLPPVHRADADQEWEP